VGCRRPRRGLGLGAGRLRCERLGDVAERRAGRIASGKRRDDGLAEAVDLAQELVLLALGLRNRFVVLLGALVETLGLGQELRVLAIRHHEGSDLVVVEALVHDALEFLESDGRHDAVAPRVLERAIHRHNLGIGHLVDDLRDFGVKVFVARDRILESGNHLGFEALGLFHVPGRDRVRESLVGVGELVLGDLPGRVRVTIERVD
jgi:hypothetical protein